MWKKSEMWKEVWFREGNKINIKKYAKELFFIWKKKVYSQQCNNLCYKLIKNNMGRDSV